MFTPFLAGNLKLAPQSFLAVTTASRNATEVLGNLRSSASRQKNSMHYTCVDLVLDIKTKMELSKIDVTSTVELLNYISLMNFQLQIISHNMLI